MGLYRADSDASAPWDCPCFRPAQALPGPVPASDVLTSAISRLTSDFDRGSGPVACLASLAVSSSVFLTPGPCHLTSSRPISSRTAHPRPKQPISRVIAGATPGPSRHPIGHPRSHPGSDPPSGLPDELLGEPRRDPVDDSSGNPAADPANKLGDKSAGDPASHVPVESPSDLPDELPGDRGSEPLDDLRDEPARELPGEPANEPEGDTRDAGRSLARQPGLTLRVSSRICNARGIAGQRATTAVDAVPATTVAWPKSASMNPHPG